MGKTPKKKKPKRKPSAYNKHVGREMRAGKTMKQAAASWKKKGGTSKSKPKSGGSRRSSSKTGGRRLGKSTFNTQKIFGFLRKAALFAPAVGIAMKPLTNEAKLREGIRAYTSYDYVTGTSKLEHLAVGWLPFIYTSIVTYGVPKLIGIIKGLF